MRAYRGLAIGLAFVLALVVAGPAGAGTVLFSQAGVQIPYPDDWTSEIDGDVLTLSHEVGGIGIAFTILESEDMDAAATEMDQAITEQFGEITEGETQEISIGGLPGVVVDATAQEGKIELAVLLLVTPNGKVMMSFAAAQTEVIDVYMKDIESIFTGIKPIPASTSGKKG